LYEINDRKVEYIKGVIRSRKSKWYRHIWYNIGWGDMS